MVVVAESLECVVPSSWFEERIPWRPNEHRELDHGERLVRRILRAHGIAHHYEQWLFPVGYKYLVDPKKREPLGYTVPVGMCPDIRILGDDRFAEQYLEITTLPKLGHKRARITKTIECFPGVIITLVDAAELVKIEADPGYLLTLLVPTPVEAQELALAA